MRTQTITWTAIATGLFMSMAVALADPQTPPARPAVVTAPAEPAVPAQPAAATTPASEKLICKQEVHQGMIVHTNTCKTKAEWDNMIRTQQRDIADFQKPNH